MAKTVKTCDLPISIALTIFKMLNPRDVRLAKFEGLGTVVVTNTEPKDLKYPEGWYYAKGTFRNKHTSSTGIYDAAIMMNSKMETWDALGANYCTRFEE